MITLEEIMTPNPITLSRFHSLSDARQLMDEKRFRHIPIVDDDKRLIGLVTQRTVLANASSSQNLIDAEELKKIEQGTLLADLMTVDLTTATPTMKISNAARLLQNKKFGCLPIVDNDYKLVGIITNHDFVAITIQLLDIMEVAEPPELS
ncbi:CBS domain-containing protein [Aliikangiella coralliicola]|uniref:CBS domain-containing protein n=1 Tax=Aliikangiella coralliicola TaxID=2592383 RepID=A0A545U0I8_9GAMM|nr:CBS domain-containing protein [Aliikangiella coralliicola]TQV82981.1 CBS domain-containing protein [Aliikangiella coralliicola]